MKKNQKKYTYLVATGLFVLSTAVIPFAVNADTTNAQPASSYKTMFAGKLEGKMGDNRGVRGAVTAISGTSITLTDKKGAIYTVDAASATVRKDKTAIQVADIKVGDTVLIEGVVSGNTVAAKSILDGTMPMHPLMGKNKLAPGVTGTVSAVSGTTITLADKAGTTYAVDAANVKFPSGPFGLAESLGSIAVGDVISVRGTVSGTNVTATTINDISYISRTVFGGKVASISGATITITGMKNETHTIDATNAKFTKGFRKETAITLADVKVGDMITAIGTLNGQTVAATAIQDNGTPPARAMFRGTPKKTK